MRKSWYDELRPCDRTRIAHIAVGQVATTLETLKLSASQLAMEAYCLIKYLAESHETHQTLLDNIDKSGQTLANGVAVGQELRRRIGWMEVLNPTATLQYH